MPQELVKLKRRSLRRSAKSRGIPFDLSIQDVVELLNEKVCYYSGRTLSPKTFSVDRKDCSKGYVKDNVVACDKDINSLKSRLIEDPFTRLSKEELKRFLLTLSCIVE